MSLLDKTAEERERQLKDALGWDFLGWVAIGRAEGIIEAADVAESLGHPDVAKAIRARMPSEVSVHECKSVDESGGMDAARRQTRGGGQ